MHSIIVKVRSSVLYTIYWQPIIGSRIMVTFGFLRQTQPFTDKLLSAQNLRRRQRFGLSKKSILVCQHQEYLHCWTNCTLCHLKSPGRSQTLGQEPFQQKKVFRDVRVEPHQIDEILDHQIPKLWNYNTLQPQTISRNIAHDNFTQTRHIAYFRSKWHCLWQPHQDWNHWHPTHPLCPIAYPVAHKKTHRAAADPVHIHSLRCRTAVSIQIQNSRTRGRKLAVVATVPCLARADAILADPLCSEHAHNSKYEPKFRCGTIQMPRDMHENATWHVLALFEGFYISFAYPKPKVTK